MKYNDNGTFKDIYVKASDTLPIGAEVEFDGENIPGGYEVSINPNLFDGTTIVSGKGLNGTTGQPYDAASRSYYEYMEALENRTYILKDITPASICFYDSTQTFISSVSGEMTFTTPADTAYIRVAFNNTLPYTGASLTRQIQRIKKVEQSIGVLGKVLNAQSSSNQDTYSCDYINDLTDAQEVDYTQYFNLDTTNVINTINAIYCVKIGKLVFLNYDFALKNSVSVTNGQLVIGTCTDKLAYTAYGFGRTTRNNVVYPATSIAIKGGQFRIMPHDTNRPEYIAGEVIFVTTD